MIGHKWFGTDIYYCETKYLNKCSIRVVFCIQNLGLKSQKEIFFKYTKIVHFKFENNKFLISNFQLSGQKNNNKVSKFDVTSFAMPLGSTRSRLPPKWADSWQLLLLLCCFACRSWRKRSWKIGREMRSLTHSLLAAWFTLWPRSKWSAGRSIRSRASPTHTMAKCTCAVNHSVTGAMIFHRKTVSKELHLKGMTPTRTIKVGNAVPRKVRQCYEARIISLGI